MDLLHRIRWANVARALAIVAALVLLVTWPSLRRDPPALPPEPAVASEGEGEEFALDRPPPPEPAARPQPRRPKVERRARRAKRPARRERRARARVERPAPAAPQPRVVVPRAPRWVAPARPAPQDEFSFE
jgi:hypothetical protein